MHIGDRLKALREHRNISRGAIEERTGLLRVYVFRAENGHTVPGLETLEKFARALEIPLYHFFTMERNRLRQVPFRHRQMRAGAVPGGTPRLYLDFASYWVGWIEEN